MPETMQALMKTHPARGAELREVKVPEIGPNDVLVKVRATSICGTDLHIYNWDDWARQRIRPPMTFGHEFCGHVAAFGSEVKSVKEGDFVSAEMHVACGHCLQCRTGDAHICREVKIIGVDADGCFADYVKIPGSNIWKIDPRIPVDYASVLDPLGNAVHTVLAGEIAAKTVAVLGCGPIGLFAISVARACGAAQIYAFEVKQQRLELATRMGADVALNSSQVDPTARVLDATSGLGVDVVLEMSGHPDAIHQGLRMLRRGGRMTLLGIPSRPVEIDLTNDIIFKGAVLQGINGRRMFHTWYQMQALLMSGKLDLSPVITDRIPLADFRRGFDMLMSGNASKLVMYPNAEDVPPSHPRKRMQHADPARL
jgi:threonine 3-dehydrogenase